MVSKKDFKKDFFKKAFADSRFNPKGDRVPTELNSFFDNINDDDSIFLSKRGSDNNLDQHSSISPPTPRSLTPKLQKNKSYSSFSNENANSQYSGNHPSGSKRLSVFSKASSSNLSRMPSSYSTKHMESHANDNRGMPDSASKQYSRNNDLYSDTRSIKSMGNRSMYEMRSFNNNNSNSNAADFNSFQQQSLPSYSPYNSPIMQSPKLYSSPSYHSMQQPHALNHHPSQNMMAPPPMSPQLMSPSSAFSSSPSSPSLANPQFMPMSPQNGSPFAYSNHQQPPFSPLSQSQQFSPLSQHAPLPVQQLNAKPPTSASSSSTTTANNNNNNGKPQRASIVLTTRQIDLVTSSWAKGFDKINLKVQSNPHQQVNEDSSMTVESLSFLLNNSQFWYNVFERVQYSEHPELLESLPSPEIVKVTYSTVIEMFISCLKHQPIQFTEIKEYLSGRERLHESAIKTTKKNNSEVKSFYNTLVDAISFCLKDHYKQFYTSELRSSWLSLLSYVSVGIMGKCPIDLIIRKITYANKNQASRQQHPQPQHSQVQQPPQVQQPENRTPPRSSSSQDNHNVTSSAGQSQLSKQQLKQLEQLQIPAETSSANTSNTTNTMGTSNTASTSATGTSENAESGNGNSTKQYLTHKFSISNLATYKSPAGMALHMNNNIKFSEIGRAESVKSDSPSTVENPFYKRNLVSAGKNNQNGNIITNNYVKDGI